MIVLSKARRKILSASVSLAAALAEALLLRSKLLHCVCPTNNQRLRSREGELIYPKSPPVEPESLWRRWLVFLLPASEVAWDCSLFLGQGTYSTEGLHLGAQRR